MTTSASKGPFDTGEPQRTLTLPETAEVLGLTLEALEAQIRAAGGTP